ncbi:response regulator transcription factor [Olsenella sp. HMSC062G07]|uniref:response regulator transcription factor n=1 Tax=Olsenella sp. HMSC062G07 TaxID=1739330 RepID=UPI0009F4379C|nr:response regulator transcription factor [Olsenella sp. HMSC062G07]
MYRILLVDDDRDIVGALKIYLQNPDYELLCAYDGKQAVATVEQGIEDSRPVDLVLLDVMMPVMDGPAALVQIRKLSNVPVIMLTAKSEDADKVLGLDLGADDYVTKPFVPAELLARVRSALRRYKRLGAASPQEEEAATTLVLGGIELDDAAKKVTVDGEAVALTPKEYDICHFLMKHPGRVFSPAAIYEAVWGAPSYGCENTVAVHVRHLREKIEINPAEPRYLMVVWGRGYKMGGVR